MSYEAEHSRAFASVKKAGSAVVFNQERPGQHNPRTATFGSVVVANVEGVAIQVQSNEDELRFAVGEIIKTGIVTLFFVPKTKGQVPALNSLVEWASVKRRVIAMAEAAQADARGPDDT